MKYLIALLFVATTLTVSNVDASDKKQKHAKIVQKHSQESAGLTLDQKQILTSAITMAKKDGHKNPYILPGIIMVESKAGTAKKFRTARHKPSYDQSVGLVQIIASTAKGVVNRHPELKKQLSNKGLAYDLANNDKFNMSVASSYLSDLSEFAHTEDQLIAAYNTGHLVKRPEKMKYVKLVQTHVARIKKEL